MAMFDRINTGAMPGGGMDRTNTTVGGPLKQRRPVQMGENYTPSGAYQAAVPTQAQNYDEIMQGYRNILGGGGGGGYDSLINQYQQLLGQQGQFKPVSYEDAPEWQAAHAKLTELANTGGITADEQASLRARGISPIRSMYANMQREMQRRNRLGGGTGANFNAVAAKMAREGSQQQAEAATNVNASIAEAVQKGRLASAPELARLVAQKNELANKFKLENQANEARWNQNQGGLLAQLQAAIAGRDDRGLNALRGMTSLYGTNPALVETFGNQVGQQNAQANQAAAARASNKTIRNRAALGA